MISNAIISVLMIPILIKGEGGIRVQGYARLGPPPNLFSHRRRLENFFMGSPSR